jgi:hypothetical protein
VISLSVAGPQPTIHLGEDLPSVPRQPRQCRCIEYLAPGFGAADQMNGSLCLSRRYSRISSADRVDGANDSYLPMASRMRAVRFAALCDVKQERLISSGITAARLTVRRSTAGRPAWRSGAMYAELTGFCRGVTKDLGIHSDTIDATCRKFVDACLPKTPRYRSFKKNLDFVPFSVSCGITGRSTSET